MARREGAGAEAQTGDSNILTEIGSSPNAGDGRGRRRSIRAPETGRLLSWYRRCRRDLPWRRTRDPYLIWVSEVMLQQTRVDAVVPYYQRFVLDFPTLQALAEAPLDRVLARWSGLGYYDRARSLHAAVRECAGRYHGRVPRDPDAFGALKGVGPYTRAAVLSIAFGVPLAVVDGNVIRVISRLRGLAGHAKSAVLKQRVGQQAQALMPSTSAGDFNQALMELGATVCTPKAPRCDDCPVAAGCHARASGDPGRWPEAAPRRTRRAVAWTVALVERGDRVLLARRGERGRWKGMWELPWVAGEFAEIGPAYGLDLAPRIDVGGVRAHLRHAVLAELITVVVRSARLSRPIPAGAERFEWVARAELSERALSSVWLKVIRACSALPVRRRAGEGPAGA